MVEFFATTGVFLQGVAAAAAVVLAALEGPDLLKKIDSLAGQIYRFNNQTDRSLNLINKALKKLNKRVLFIQETIQTENKTPNQLVKEIKSKITAEDPEVEVILDEVALGNIGIGMDEIEHKDFSHAQVLEAIKDSIKIKNKSTGKSYDFEVEPQTDQLIEVQVYLDE